MKSACEKFRAGLEVSIDQRGSSAQECLGDVLWQFDALHQSSEENTGDCCSSRDGEDLTDDVMELTYSCDCCGALMVPAHGSAADPHEPEDCIRFLSSELRATQAWLDDLFTSRG